MRRLLIRPGAIGDCIVSLPALESLRAEFTEVWVAEQNVPLIRFADRVRSIGSTGLNLLEIPDLAPPGLLETLRSFDEIVSWYGAGRNEFRQALLAVNSRCRFFPALPTGMHAVDFYLSQVGALPSHTTPAAPRIPCPRHNEGFAVIHPFSGSARKNWPLARYRQLAGQLAAQLPVEWCAGPEEELAEARRFSDLYTLACHLARASIYIGNDSGISHLAAAVGVPVVAIFGPSDPAVWAPRGPAVSVLRGQPIERVTVEEVLEAVRALLASTRPGLAL